MVVDAGEPFFALQVGSWEWYCTVEDPGPPPRTSKADGKLSRRAASSTFEHHVSVDSNSSSLLQEDVMRGWSMDSAARETVKANGDEDSELERGAWKPQLPRIPVNLADEDAAAIKTPEWWELPYAPVPRERAGPSRRAARDYWNVEELRLGNTLARGEYQCAEGLDEPEFRAVLADCWGDALDEEDFQWTLLLATRTDDIQSHPVSVQELHYAMRAWHGTRSLPFHALRELSTFDLRPLGDTTQEALQDLRALMKELNDDMHVYDVEVKLVADEAAALGFGHVSREGLRRAIGAWYANIQRQDTSILTLFRAWCGQWAGAADYHAELMYQLSRLSTKRHPPRVADEDAFGATQVGTSPLQRPAVAEAAPGASHVASVSFLERALQVTRAVCAAALVLSALVLPAAFFGWLIFVGSEHGTDQCPEDLDGLMIWFGVLGIAGLAVDCVEGELGGPRLGQVKRMQERPKSLVAFGWTSFALRVVLAVFPWVGTAWSFRLTQTEQAICGKFLWATSALLWPMLLFLELALASVFFWGLAVWAEHEISLRYVLAAPERAPQLSPLATGSGSPGGRSPERGKGARSFQPAVPTSHSEP